MVVKEKGGRAGREMTPAKIRCKVQKGSRQQVARRWRSFLDLGSPGCNLVVFGHEVVGGAAADEGCGLGGFRV